METNKKKKKKMLTTGLAVALAATLMIGGGTLAYLQSNPANVVNEFATHKVEVTLTENTGDKYNIIPGTEQPKDPTVTVENTVAAYVFVEVTDTTEGLVGYEIAARWNKLDGHDNVYYREVAAQEEGQTQAFSVLKGDKVTYAASLANSDMVDENGQLKKGINLTFTASAIQKEGFASAKDAYEGKAGSSVSSINDIRDAISVNSSEKRIVLSDNVVYNSTLDSEIDTKGKRMMISKTMELDLAGKDITFESGAGNNNFAAFYVNSAKGNLTVNGEGTIDATATTGAYCFHLSGGPLSKPTLTINDGTYIGNPTAVNVEYGTAYINGGFFNCKPTGNVTDDLYRYTLNCKDERYKAGYAKIIVTGGTFVNFNPADNQAEGPHTNFVADGYEVTSEQHGEDIWYTVVKKQA